MRVRMGYSSAPEQECLLIDTIALCWLRVKLFEQFLSQYSTDTTYQIAIVEHFEHRLARCHRRYIEAMVALARVRKLGINVQINVAQNQIVANG